jgi:hypothetical protein
LPIRFGARLATAATGTTNPYGPSAMIFKFGDARYLTSAAHYPFAAITARLYL